MRQVDSGSGRMPNLVKAAAAPTFWIDGEKIRIETIDAPEVKGQCASERELAAKATRRLRELLADQKL